MADHDLTGQDIYEFSYKLASLRAKKTQGIEIAMTPWPDLPADRQEFWTEKARELQHHHRKFDGAEWLKNNAQPD